MIMPWHDMTIRSLGPPQTVLLLDVLPVDEATLSGSAGSISSPFDVAAGTLVTLVGAIAADVGLFLPDCRASERTFQLLTQVAGRAGRSALGGEVVVQTYHPEHYAIQAASEHDYEGFYREEMAFRRQQAYPPLRRLARLVYHHGQRARVQEDAEALAATLRGEIAAGGVADTDLIGPAPCFFARQRGEWRWQVVVRGPEPAALLRRVALGPGWRVDVDPVDLL